MSVTYHLTTDQEWLNQYHALRRESYHRDKYMKGHFNQGLPDEYDLCSDVIVAVEDGMVIGGSRLTHTSPQSPRLLPSEKPGKTFPEILQKKELCNCIYGELHRFVIKKDHRNEEIIASLLLHSYRQMVEQNWDYFFTPSVAVKARFYRRICKKIDISIEIVPGVRLTNDTYDNTEILLMKCDIKNQKAFRQIRDEKR